MQRRMPTSALTIATKDGRRWFCIHKRCDRREIARGDGKVTPAVVTAHVIPLIYHQSPECCDHSHDRPLPGRAAFPLSDLRPLFPERRSGPLRQLANGLFALCGRSRLTYVASGGSALFRTDHLTAPARSDLQFVRQGGFLIGIHDGVKYRRAGRAQERMHRCT